jgi:hypothetical protein
MHNAITRNSLRLRLFHFSQQAFQLIAKYSATAAAAVSKAAAAGPAATAKHNYTAADKKDSAGASAGYQVKLQHRQRYLRAMSPRLQSFWWRLM